MSRDGADNPFARWDPERHAAMWRYFKMMDALGPRCSICDTLLLLSENEEGSVSARYCPNCDPVVEQA